MFSNLQVICAATVLIDSRIVRDVSALLAAIFRRALIVKDPAHLLRPLSGERKIRFSKNACMCMVCGCTLVFENYFWWKNIHIDYHNHIYAISSSQITQITLNSMWFYVKFRVKLFWHIRWVVTSQSTWTSLESTKIRNSYHGITLLPQIWKISSLWISHRIT